MLDTGVLSITQDVDSQEGTAFVRVTGTTADTINIAFDMYIGDGTGADGLCVNLGADRIGDRQHNDGVAVGFSLCFDEYARGGVVVRQDGTEVWSDISDATVSAFEDATWHAITLIITPTGDAAFTLDLDTCQGDVNIAAYSLPSQLYLGFSSRTGGLNNNHWIRNVAFGTNSKTQTRCLSTSEWNVAAPTCSASSVVAVSVTTHWGSSACASDHTMLYAGRVIGSSSSLAGSGANYMCLQPRDVECSDFSGTYNDSPHWWGGVMIQSGCTVRWGAPGETAQRCSSVTPSLPLALLLRVPSLPPSTLTTRHLLLVCLPVLIVDRCWVLEWHLAPFGEDTCNSGETVSQEQCEAAVLAIATAAGETPGRALQTGDGEKKP